MQAEGRGARLLGGGEGDGSGRQVWELPSGEQVSEEELQLLALAEEVRHFGRHIGWSGAHCKYMTV